VYITQSTPPLRGEGDGGADDEVKGDWEREDFSTGDWELGSDDELGEGPIISPVQSDAEHDEAADTGTIRTFFSLLVSLSLRLVYNRKSFDFLLKRTCLCFSIEENRGDMCELFLFVCDLVLIRTLWCLKTEKKRESSHSM
jgi:hypothetical protein